MNAGYAVAGAAAPRGLRARLAHRLSRLLPADRRLLHRCTPPKETTVATLGPVELRRTRAGFVARTAVKGEPDAALQTALLRLADYTCGHNHPGTLLTPARPVVLLPGAHGTWLVRVGLPGVHAASAAPIPRSGKVRILAQPSETLAIIRVSGRPRSQAVARGEAAIRAAIAGSAWVPCAPPMVRFHAPSGLLPWTGGFEVAIAVTGV